MYGMTNSGKLFADEMTEWLIEEGFIQSRYAYYFPEYAQYFGRALKLLKSMYGMTNSGKLFAD